MGLGLARAFLVAVGLLLLVGGLGAVLSADPGLVVGGIWLLVAGAVILLAVAFERTRYRSEAAERAALAPGPGGGEAPDTELEPRFARTDEVFEDPTSRRRMRVWLDRSTGERRYRAEDGRR